MDISDLHSISEQPAPADHSVIRESRFFKSLQASVTAQQQADFNLLLSMVSQDATELDQFHTPRTRPLTEHSDLQKKFFVSEKPLVGPNSSSLEMAQHTAVCNGELATVHLNYCLHSPTLVNEVYDVDAEVFDNLDFNVRQRLLKIAEQEENAKEPSGSAFKQKQQATAPHKSEEVYPNVDKDSWFNVLAEARTLSTLSA